MTNDKLFKSVVIYSLAYLTGANFATVPALSSVFTDASLFGLSTARLGNLFIPQVLSIIISSLAAPFLVNKYGPKKVLILGVACMLSATAILWASHYFYQDKSIRRTGEFSSYFLRNKN